MNLIYFFDSSTLLRIWLKKKKLTFFSISAKSAVY